jgi:uridylate kinase
MLGRAAPARRRIAEVVERMRRTGDVPGIAMTLHNAALVEAVLGADDTAIPLLAESIATGAETLPIYSIGWRHLLQAQLLLNTGDTDAAAAARAAATGWFDALGDERGHAAVLRTRKAVPVTIPGADTTGDQT